MEKIPVENTTAMPIYVGAAMIPPGETRHFDIDQVPHHLRPVSAPVDTAAPDPADALGELLKGSVAEVKDKLADMTLEDIERLGELEQTGQARKTLLSAIADEVLQRQADAEIAAFLAMDEAEVLANISLLEDSALARVAEMETAGQNRAAVVEAIAAEQLKRAG